MKKGANYSFYLPEQREEKYQHAHVLIFMIVRRE